MTNEELLADLRQFIDSRLSQETAQLAKDMQSIEGRLATRIDGLDVKLDEVQDAIAETLSQATEAVDVTEKLHEFDKRLLRLERHTV